MAENHGRFPVTLEGYRKMESDLDVLKNKIKGSITEIAEARKHGDLSENYEYKAAKEDQARYDTEYKKLKTRLENAEIINIENVNQDKVHFGATIKIEDDESNKILFYRIVGEYEADPDTGTISCNSPIARAMLGKGKGDYFEVHTPNSTRYYRILEISYDTVV